MAAATSSGTSKGSGAAVALADVLHPSQVIARPPDPPLCNPVHEPPKEHRPGQIGVYGLKCELRVCDLLSPTAGQLRLVSRQRPRSCRRQQVVVLCVPSHGNVQLRLPRKNGVLALFSVGGAFSGSCRGWRRFWRRFWRRLPGELRLQSGKSRKSFRVLRPLLDK